MAIITLRGINFFFLTRAPFVTKGTCRKSVTLIPLSTFAPIVYVHYSALTMLRQMLSTKIGAWPSMAEGAVSFRQGPTTVLAGEVTWGQIMAPLRARAPPLHFEGVMGQR